MATLPDRGFTSQFLNAAFQQGLAQWNSQRLAPAFPSDDWQLILDGDAKMLRLEGGFLEELRAEIADEAAAAPRDPAAFLAWFENLQDSGPGLDIENATHGSLGLGLRNIEERLERVYGDAGTLRLTSAGTGTTAELLLPYVPASSQRVATDAGSTLT